MQRSSSTPELKRTIQPLRLKRMAFLLLATGIIFFVGMFLTQLTSTAPYSMSKQSISSLGVTTCGKFTEPQTHKVYDICSPLHLVMDGTFVACGVLTFLATQYGLRFMWPGRKQRTVGLTLLYIGGASEVMAGLFPVNVHPLTHSIGGGIAIASLNLALIFLGLAARKVRRKLGRLTLLWGIVGMIGFVLDGPPYPILGYGGWERVAGCAFPIWGLCVGGYWVYCTARTKTLSAAHG